MIHMFSFDGDVSLEAGFRRRARLVDKPGGTRLGDQKTHRRLQLDISSRQANKESGKSPRVMSRGRRLQEGNATSLPETSDRWEGLQLLGFWEHPRCCFAFRMSILLESQAPCRTEELARVAATNTVKRQCACQVNHLPAWLLVYVTNSVDVAKRLQITQVLLSSSHPVPSSSGARTARRLRACRSSATATTARVHQGKGLCQFLEASTTSRWLQKGGPDGLDPGIRTMHWSMVEASWALDDATTIAVGAHRIRSKCLLRSLVE